MTNPHCHDSDRLKRKATDLLQESREKAQSAMRLEAMAFDAEFAALDHASNCDLCQGKGIPLEPIPLLGLK